MKSLIFMSLTKSGRNCYGVHIANRELLRSSTHLGLFLPTPLRYEEEINKRTAAENDFVVLKKVREEGDRKGNE